ncbi:hypothetical protein [Gloeothece verrucosa]|uniref:Uncharacterized protein n=1 Tax=Gloeothece verrucosa (strain PCC 7822) TaxID=497965 RepID=E0U535_GLOV7|nr:hypothetical protein [Gloeothece verrucosa]ADN12314.1 conserved hypothetical protein [Gloeothece verrucosa PCC 7822]
MKTPKKLTLGISLLCLGSLTAITQPLSAQSGNTNLDNLPDNSQQMRIWGCSKGESSIEVEAKDVNIWKDMIEGGGWQCNEQIEPIAQSDVMLSCDPYDVIGNLTLVWLNGEQGKQQLQAWMKQLSEQPGMICRISDEGAWGGLENK